MMLGLVFTAVLASQLNPDVTQATIQETICKSGWPEAYRKAHPIPVPTKPGMVVDHNVSIELGGASDKSNMRYQTVANGKAKDRIENDLNDLVCTGLMPLKDAQKMVVQFKDQ